ncbi:MAG TPA: hypothetical protein VM940_16505 [Chthoniobacterales bacterium]|nr:hypothetical protein [Chthoniobacterales bacterium]
MALASIHAQDFKARLSEANSERDIREFYSKFGDSREAFYTSGNIKLFALWVQPKDRAGATFLWLYLLRSGRWHLLVDHPETGEFAGDSVTISVVDGTVRLISPDGHVTKTYEIR